MTAKLICIMRHKLGVIVRSTEVKKLLDSLRRTVLTLLHWYLTSIHLEVIDMYDLLRVEGSLVQFHHE